MKEMKFIITYGHKYNVEIFGFARNIADAKKAIVECVVSTGVDIEEVQCHEVVKKNIESKLSIKLS